MKSLPYIFGSITLFVVSVLLVVVASSCQRSGNLQLGMEIPDDLEVTPLAAILEDPAAYNGKSVVMEGTISGQCPALCEFFFSDAAHTVTVWPQGYKFPKLETGKKVTVYANVTSGDEQVVVSALGLTMN